MMLRLPHYSGKSPEGPIVKAGSSDRFPTEPWQPPESHVSMGLAIVIVFTLTSFLGALLLFLVQPILGRMALPVFGGGPGVWNTTACFFQTVLLAGYAYAHFG